MRQIFFITMCLFASATLAKTIPIKRPNQETVSTSVLQGGIIDRLFHTATSETDLIFDVIHTSDEDDNKSIAATLSFRFNFN